MTEAVVFDMDGVLIDSGAHHRAAWRALLEEIGEEPAHPEPWRLTIGRPSEEAVPLLLNRRLSDYEVRRLARRKRDLYVDFARAGLLTVPGVSRVRWAPPPPSTTCIISWPAPASSATSTSSSPPTTSPTASPTPRCTCSRRPACASRPSAASSSRTRWWGCRRRGGRACARWASPPPTLRTSS